MKNKRHIKLSIDELRKYSLSLRPDIENIASRLGFILEDLSFVFEYNHYFFRVTISNQLGKVTINDCELVSREIDKVLDLKDPFPFLYSLEVQSKGIEEKSPSDKFEHEFILEKAGLTIRT